MNQYKTYSEAEVLRQAEALRTETIRAFFAGLFRTSEKAAPAMPLHAAPAE